MENDRYFNSMMPFIPTLEEDGDFWHHTVKYDSNVSYGTLFDYAENFWMLLYFAVYLTECAAAESAGRKVLNLRFPNLEVKQVFADLIDHINLKLLPQGTVNDVIDACFAGDSSRISSLLSELLLSVISYFDYQELFYHAFVCGLFSGRAGIKVKSNLGMRPHLQIWKTGLKLLWRRLINCSMVRNYLSAAVRLLRSALLSAVKAAWPSAVCRQPDPRSETATISKTALPRRA